MSSKRDDIKMHKKNKDKYSEQLIYLVHIITKCSLNYTNSFFLKREFEPTINVDVTSKIQINR